jgi:hypothetical protein
MNPISDSEKSVDAYEILNRVKPEFQRATRDFLDPKKIILTQKNIKILVKDMSSKKTGSSDNTLITYYEHD